MYILRVAHMHGDGSDPLPLHTHTHTHTHTHMPTHVHAHTHPHTCTHARTQSCSRRDSRRRGPTPVLNPAPFHTHSHAQRSHTRTTHTHTRSPARRKTSAPDAPAAHQHSFIADSSFWTLTHSTKDARRDRALGAQQQQQAAAGMADRFPPPEMKATKVGPRQDPQICEGACCAGPGSQRVTCCRRRRWMRRGCPTSGGTTARTS